MSERDVPKSRGRLSTKGRGEKLAENKVSTLFESKVRIHQHRNNLGDIWVMLTNVWIIAIAVFFYYTLTVIRAKETPLDTDSANHLRLGQLWRMGYRPDHPYRLGVKWLVPRLGFILYPLVRRAPHRWRVINAIQFSLSHLIVGMIPNLTLPQIVLGHLGLIAINLSPFVFPLTSNADVGATVIPWSLAILISTQEPGIFSLLASLASISVLAVLWKISEVAYILPLLAVWASFTDQEIGLLLASTVLFGFGALLTLLAYSKKTALISKIHKYRATRTIRRQKVLWPASALVLMTALSIPGIVAGLSHIPLWVWLMTAAALARNILSGDFATGTGAYHLFFPVFIVYWLINTQWTNVVLLVFLLLSLIPFSSPSAQVGEVMRRISSGAGFPSRKSRLDLLSEWFQSEGCDARKTVLLGTDTPLAFKLELGLVEGTSYSSIHTEYWGSKAFNPVKALHAGLSILVSAPLKEDLKRIDSLSGFKRIDAPIPGVTLILAPNLPTD